MAIVLVACSSTATPAITVPQPTSVVALPLATNPIAPTSIATPILPKPTSTLVPSLTPSPTKQLSANSHTPITPRLDGFVGIAYELESERTLGRYTVRTWSVPTETIEFIGKAITIAAENQPTLQIEKILEIDLLTGEDLTADGFPEIVVTVATGGASCCFSVEVYSLGPEPTRILNSPYSQFGGKFLDLDNDGVYEFITADNPANSFCGYPNALTVDVIYKYQEGRYHPSSQSFPNYYSKTIIEHTALAEDAKPSNGDWDGTTKCSVLPLVLVYLYSGQTTQAWEALQKYYVYPDVDKLRSEIDTLVKASPSYAP